MRTRRVDDMARNGGMEPGLSQTQIRSIPHESTLSRKTSLATGCRLDWKMQLYVSHHFSASLSSQGRKLFAQRIVSCGQGDSWLHMNFRWDDSY
jgi:hypothetical protein